MTKLRPRTWSARTLQRDSLRVSCVFSTARPICHKKLSALELQINMNAAFVIVVTHQHISEQNRHNDDEQDPC